MTQHIVATIHIKDPIGILEPQRAMLAGQLEAAIRHTWGATAENLKVDVIAVSGETRPERKA